jgi:hypothetical protein
MSGDRPLSAPRRRGAAARTRALGAVPAASSSAAPGLVPPLDPELRRDLVSLLADALVARYRARAGEMGVSPTGPAQGAEPGRVDGTTEAVREGA